jgi:hypothetical protein
MNAVGIGVHLSVVRTYERVREKLGVRESVHHVAAQLGMAPVFVAILLGFPAHYGDGTTTPQQRLK